MGLFDWFRRDNVLRLQTPDDDPHAKRLRMAQQKNDYATVADFFRTLSDPDAREFYVANLTQWPGRPAFFDHWVKAMPECAEAWLLRGAHGVQWAWEARTGARASAQGGPSADPIRRRRRWSCHCRGYRCCRRHGHTCHRRAHVIA